MGDDKIMVMANSLTEQKRASQAVLTKTQWAIAEAMADGKSGPELARKLGKGDLKKTASWRRKIRRMQLNPHFRKAMFDLQTAEGMMGLGPAVQGMNARAARGRTDAVKLLMSFTGIHNEKVSHEHSGDIQINVSIPRPQTTVDQIGPGKDYVDAEVVEE